MNSLQKALGFVSLSAIGFSLFACQPGGVGDPCTPEDEYSQTFSGYGVEEANAETRSFQCETRVCLVNHFRGRVSCPYGQTETIAAVAAAYVAGTSTTLPDTGKACHLPGSTAAKDLVTVPVDPQLVNRRAADTVYCSCRCKGKDSSARYCDCPSGYTCTEVLPDVGLGQEQLAGSYCIKDGTAYKASDTTGEDCSGDSCPTEGVSDPTANP